MKPKTGRTRQIAREGGSGATWAPTGKTRKRLARRVKRGHKAKATSQALRDDT